MNNLNLSPFIAGQLTSILKIEYNSLFNTLNAPPKEIN